jgi:hypothetical protein
MASSGSIWVSLGLKTDKFSKGISNARGNLKGFKKSTSTLEGGIKKLGVTMAATFALSSVKSFFSSSLAAYDEQIQAQRKLENALGFTSAALQNQASELQKVTRFGDEATMQMQAQLATLGLTEKQIYELTPLVQDLSAQTGKGLAKSAKEVVSALSTGSTTLAKYGVELSGANSMSENFDLTIQGLSNSVGGAAEKMANEGSGGAIQLENAYGDLKESIGKIVSEGLNELTPALLKNAEAMKEIADDSTLEWWEKFGIMITGTESAMAGFNKQLTHSVDESTNNQEALSNAQKGLTNLNKAYKNGEISLSTYNDAVAKVKGAFDNKLAALKPLNDEVKGATTNIKILTKAEVEAAEKTRRLADNFKEINNIKVSFGRITKETRAAFSGMLEGLGTEKKKMIIPVTPTLKMDSGEGIKESTGTIFAELTDIVTNAAAGFAEMGATVIGEAMGTMFAGGDVSEIGQDFLLGVAGMINSIGQQIIALGIAAVLAKEALKGLFANPALAIAAGVGLVAISSAMTSVLSQDPTAFAQGGLVTGATMGLVGEGRGTTRNNPEVISPLDKLQAMLPDGGGMGGEVRFRIEGNELVGILNRHTKNNKYSS